MSKLKGGAVMGAAMALCAGTASAFADQSWLGVTLTAPESGAVYEAPAIIPLLATVVELAASARSERDQSAGRGDDRGGARGRDQDRGRDAERRGNPHERVVQVEFYQGETLAGIASAAPYAYTWSTTTPGVYALSARAVTAKGEIVRSAPVAVIVNALPTVSLTAPADGARYNAPAKVILAAEAADPDGTIAKVEFYANGSLIGGATQAPYTVVWSNVPAGSYSLAVIATDSDGGAATSPAIAVRVNSYPSVALTSPAANAAFEPEATITLTASAQDVDGAISRVEFYAGTTLVATVTAAPYTHAWSAAASGAYSITARAVDDNGAGTVSAPVAITVAHPQAQLYYIHTDHLNTPRVITDQAGHAVWTWTNDDPFGANPPSEDPRNTGISFTCNLRFPGQYFDKETNLHYNWMRDYQPEIGRYTESDPLGLRGGISTYLYVGGNPLRYVDTSGLQTWNGNVALGFEQQKQGCDVIGVLPFFNSNECALDCCRDHDDCYSRFRCNSSSWNVTLINPILAAVFVRLSCPACNATAVSCLASASFRSCTKICR